MYDTSVPSNVEIYVTEFRNMVTFQILQPDKLIKLYDKELTLKILMDRHMGLGAGDDVIPDAALESSGQTASFLQNMSQYILVLFAFFLFGCIMFLLATIPAIRKKVITILINVKK